MRVHRKKIIVQGKYYKWIPGGKGAYIYNSKGKRFEATFCEVNGIDDPNIIFNNQNIAEWILYRMKILEEA